MRCEHMLRCGGGTRDSVGSACMRVVVVGIGTDAAMLHGTMQVGHFDVLDPNIIFIG